MGWLPKCHTLFKFNTEVLSKGRRELSVSFWMPQGQPPLHTSLAAAADLPAKDLVTP